MCGDPYDSDYNRSYTPEQTYTIKKPNMLKRKISRFLRKLANRIEILSYKIR